jgi:hypothetical protein
MFTKPLPPTKHRNKLMNMVTKEDQQSQASKEAVQLERIPYSNCAVLPCSVLEMFSSKEEYWGTSALRALFWCSGNRANSQSNGCSGNVLCLQSCAVFRYDRPRNMDSCSHRVPFGANRRFATGYAICEVAQGGQSIFQGVSVVRDVQSAIWTPQPVQSVVPKTHPM